MHVTSKVFHRANVDTSGVVQSTLCSSFLAGTTYYFACQRWFSLHKDDGLIERDLWLSSEKPHGQQMSYLAEVHTSDVRGAGTDADVSIMLFGDLGDSGLQPLNVSCMTISDSQLLYSVCMT